MERIIFNHLESIDRRNDCSKLHEDLLRGRKKKTWQSGTSELPVHPHNSEWSCKKVSLIPGTPEGALIHCSPQRKICAQNTPSVRQQPKVMLPAHTVIRDTSANPPAPSHDNQEARSLTHLSNYRQFVLSCRLLATNLLIIYNAGYFAGGPNEDIISHNHDKVACNDYIITLFF